MHLLGVGMSKFDVDPRPSYERIVECVDEALTDSNLKIEQIDAIMVSNNETASNAERQRHTGPFLSSLFQRNLPIVTIPAACGGGGVALWNAINHLSSSSCENILVIGYEQLVSNTSERQTDEMLMAAERIYEQSEGMIFPAQNALIAQQYMLKYGATEDDFARVSFKNHQNAALNPKARFFGKNLTLDMIKDSPIVASPLRLFDCSTPCNGAAAAVISKNESDIKIAGSAVTTSPMCVFEREEMTSWNATRNSAKIAYNQAGITPKDISFAEVHDAFTPVELIAYEDLGFSSKGSGADLIRNNVTALNGSLPINTSGGLKAKGHPISASGLSQIYEIAQQMRKKAEKRQIGSTAYGLAQSIGGVGGIVAVHVLKNKAS